MDHQDVKASKMETNVGGLCSPKMQTPLEKTDSLPDRCIGLTDTSVGLQKERHESNSQINGCKAEKSPEIKRKDLDHISEVSQPFEKDVHSKTNGYWLNKGENGLKFVMHAVCPDKQYKTESSSSNSTQVVLPSSSNDSYQETSLDIKSSKHSKTDAMDTFTCTDFKGNLKESAFGSSTPGMATHAPRAEPETVISLPGKLYNLVKASETLDSVRTRNNSDNVPRMTVDSHYVENIDLLKSDLFKKENMRHINQDKADVLYDLVDALDAARRVAKEVEQGVEASGSSSSVLGRSSETVLQSFVDSADSRKKSCLTENESVIQQHDRQDTSVSVCSLKQFAFYTKDMDPDAIREGNDGHHRQESSCLTWKAESITSKGHNSHHCYLDLNENILEYEAEHPEQPVQEIVSNPLENLSKPIPVVAKSGISLCLPMSEIQKEGELGGWRGSAATSAFRPTAVSRSCRGSKVSPNNDSAKDSRVKEIDLNVAATGVEFGSELLQEKSNPAQSTFPSNESSMEVSSTQARRFDIDLNCVDENDNCYQLPPSTSSPQQFTRDFDLNDSPTSVADAFVSASQPGQATQTLRNRGLDGSAVFLMENSEQPDFRSFRSAFSAASPSLGLAHSNAQPFLVAASNMLTSNEQLQRIAAFQPKFSHMQPPPHAFICNSGFCIDPNSCLPPTHYAHGVVPYMTDPHSTTIFPQVLGSGALSVISRPQHVLQVPEGSGPSDVMILGSNVDLYNGINAVENGSRGPNARQLYIPSGNPVFEEQMRTLQPVAVSAPPMKRREPDGGWDSHQLSFRQESSWR